MEQILSDSYHILAVRIIVTNLQQPQISIRRLPFEYMLTYFLLSYLPCNTVMAVTVVYFWAFLSTFELFYFVWSFFSSPDEETFPASFSIAVVFAVVAFCRKPSKKYNRSFVFSREFREWIFPKCI